jgi:hypothetical protein
MRWNVPTGQNHRTGSALWMGTALVVPVHGIGGGRKQPRCGAATGGHASGPERVSAEPRKARFPAEAEMRPNEVLKKHSIPE